MPAHLKVCIDDSCDEKREKYVCAGSLTGNKDSWNKFNKEWRKALNRSPSIEYFQSAAKCSLPSIVDTALEIYQQIPWTSSAASEAFTPKDKGRGEISGRK